MGAAYAQALAEVLRVSASLITLDLGFNENCLNPSVCPSGKTLEEARKIFCDQIMGHQFHVRW